jgi:chlorobactene glucosyltransferase
VALVYLYAFFAALRTLSIPTAIKRILGLPVVTPRGRDKSSGTFVSVVVPMRNEEQNVVRCIGSLLSQDYERYEVIAVDDMSQDNTLSLLQGLQRNHDKLRIVRLENKPEGWVGKNYALYEGAQASVGDLLLFVDADTSSHPQMLSAVVGYLEENGIDMLSLFPRQELLSFWERVFQPFVFELLCTVFPHYKVNSTRHSTAFACGPFIMIRKDIYKEVGGHEPIKGSMNDDIDFAKLVKGKGYRIAIASGIEVVRVRMYTNFSGIWHGFVKNLFSAIGYSWPMALSTVVVFFLWGVLPSILLPFSLVSHLMAPGALKLVLALECSWTLGVGFLLRMSQLKRLNVPIYYAFLAPLASSIFIAMLLTSCYRIAFNKGVVWKERVYSKMAMIDSGSPPP